MFFVVGARLKLRRARDGKTPRAIPQPRSGEDKREGSFRLGAIPLCIKDYAKYFTPLSKMGMNFSPGTFWYRPSPRRST